MVSSTTPKIHRNILHWEHRDTLVVVEIVLIFERNLLTLSCLCSVSPKFLFIQPNSRIQKVLEVDSNSCSSGCIICMEHYARAIRIFGSGEESRRVRDGLSHPTSRPNSQLCFSPFPESIGTTRVRDSQKRGYRAGGVS